MNAQFKPGDRVLREVVIDRDPGGDDVLVHSPTPNGGWLAWVSRGSIIAPPTDAAQLRAAADVLRDRADDLEGMGCDRVNVTLANLSAYANKLEAASAPKPEPTLADRLEELWEKRGRQGFELGIVREFAEILRGEDKSPVKALAREFVDGYPTKMWPQGLLVEAFREALAREVAQS